MPWPTWILDHFATIPGGMSIATQESSFYGPYTSVLLHLFPPNEGFMVAPERQQPTIKELIYFAVMFIIPSTNTQTPIFYLEVKPPGDIDEPSTRGKADEQIRSRLGEAITKLRIPKLHGISALGVQLAFYNYDAATQAIEPPKIPPDPTHINNAAPAAHWSVNLLSDEGYQQLADRKSTRLNSSHRIASRMPSSA